VFRVLTWNMNHGFRDARQRRAAWSFLSETVKPDVALLQEILLQGDKSEQAVHQPGGIGGGRNWGSAVVTFGPSLSKVTHSRTRWSKKDAPLMVTLPGTVMIADAVLDDGSTVTMVSMYGAIEYGYAATTVHKQLSDLTPLFESKRKDQIILGGDLNCSTQLASPHGYWDANLFNRIRQFGLVDLLEQTKECRTPRPDCVCDDVPNCGHVQTFRHPRSAVPWQDDYLFASTKLAEKLVDCYALDDGEPDPWSLSDHCPIVADFEL
jgi:endonuclease/exonuclease/phosphatase family metal-dependent hydrolase